MLCIFTAWRDIHDTILTEPHPHTLTRVTVLLHWISRTAELPRRACHRYRDDGCNADPEARK